MTARVKEYLGRGLIAALFGGSMAAVFASIARMPLTLWAAFAASACAGLIFALGGIRKFTLLITLPACAACTVLLKIPQACAAMTRGEFDYPILSALAAFLFAWVSCLFSGHRSGAFLLTVLLGLSVIFSRSSEQPVPVLLLVPGILALIMQCAYTTGRRGAQWNALVPTALIAVLAAFALTPAEGVYWQPLHDLAMEIQEKADDLTDVLGQYGGFNEDRVAYSVCMDGYQPMVSMLGGPATPDLEPVMDVTSDTTLYLRGSIRRYYNGHSWIDDSVNSRYVFLDPAKRRLREEIFDTGRTETDAVTADVVFLNPSESSALFVPHRLSALDLDALSMVAYFNTAGEVFLTRPVEEGDSYRVTASPVTIDMPLIESPDDRYEEIREEYTRLPAGIDPEVYSLAETLSAGSGSARETAREIQSWLAMNCDYETGVDYPPLDRDFVSFFLTDSREGYCTYFASAFSVLCRACGIPTRYIEGYLAVPDETGVAHVTGENAHAWAEVYLSGIGWVTADPTAAARSAGGSGGAGEQSGDNSEPPENGEPDDPQSGETPENEPQDDPGAAEKPEQPEDEPETEPDEPDAEPEEEPEDEPNESPEEDPGEEPDEGGRDRSLLLLIPIVLLLAAALFIALRLRASDPARLTAKETNGLRRLLIVYRAALTALECRGIRPQPGETAEAFITRLHGEGTLSGKAVSMIGELTRAVYSGADDASGGRSSLAVYTEAVRGMNVRERVRWLARRVRRGIGSVENIP